MVHSAAPRCGADGTGPLPARGRYCVRVHRLRVRPRASSAPRCRQERDTPTPPQHLPPRAAPATLPPRPPPVPERSADSPSAPAGAPREALPADVYRRLSAVSTESATRRLQEMQADRARGNGAEPWQPSPAAEQRGTRRRSQSVPRSCGSVELRPPWYPAPGWQGGGNIASYTTACLGTFRWPEGGVLRRGSPHRIHRGAASPPPGSTPPASSVRRTPSRRRESEAASPAAPAPPPPPPAAEAQSLIFQHGSAPVVGSAPAVAWRAAGNDAPHVPSPDGSRPRTSGEPPPRAAPASRPPPSPAPAPPQAAQSPPPRHGTPSRARGSGLQMLLHASGMPQPPGRRQQRMDADAEAAVWRIDAVLAALRAGFAADQQQRQQQQQEQQERRRRQEQCLHPRTLSPRSTPDRRSTPDKRRPNMPNTPTSPAAHRFTPPHAQQSASGSSGLQVSAEEMVASFAVMRTASEMARDAAADQHSLNAVMLPSDVVAYLTAQREKESEQRSPRGSSQRPSPLLVSAETAEDVVGASRESPRAPASPKSPQRLASITPKSPRKEGVGESPRSPRRVACQLSLPQSSSAGVSRRTSPTNSPRGRPELQRRLSAASGSALSSPASSFRSAKADGPGPRKGQQQRRGLETARRQPAAAAAAPRRQPQQDGARPRDAAAAASRVSLPASSPSTSRRGSLQSTPQPPPPPQPAARSPKPAPARSPPRRRSQVDSGLSRRSSASSCRSGGGAPPASADGPVPGWRSSPVEASLRAVLLSPQGLRPAPPSVISFEELIVADALGDSGMRLDELRAAWESDPEGTLQDLQQRGFCRQARVAPPESDPEDCTEAAPTPIKGAQPPAAAEPPAAAAAPPPAEPAPAPAAARESPPPAAAPAGRPPLAPTGGGESDAAALRAAALLSFDDVLAADAELRDLLNDSGHTDTYRAAWEADPQDTLIQLRHQGFCLQL
eukprot:TRINITY_DN6517_c2_g2_i1.p1 TRINITY_DN6517_c2_g2~~TRINITY_DN6517_c2_g2_i1.p1  ORF type:complete len:983 (+),score=201.55 TRINITY_DN6517_c2_g2_i1:86-2950(+)